MKILDDFLVSDYVWYSDTLKEGLFERFYSKASGSGLGLSIVRALVERYNGRVWASDRVASSYKEGASIGMMFPKPRSSTKELSELD